MSQRSQRNLLLAIGLAGAIGACASEKKPTTTTSSVQGKLALSSFPAPPSSVDATDETGATKRATVGADGAFSIALDRGHRYRLSVTMTGRRDPVVFPRSGRAYVEVNVRGGAANVQLGAVRHVDSAPNGFKTTSAAPAGGASVECADEKGEVCANDDADVSCDNGQRDDRNDGECENGKDAKTGAPCTDNDDQESADPKGPMAIPEKNAPNDVGGCDDGEEDDD